MRLLKPTPKSSIMTGEKPTTENCLCGKSLALTKNPFRTDLDTYYGVGEKQPIHSKILEPPLFSVRPLDLVAGHARYAVLN